MKVAFITAKSAISFSFDKIKIKQLPSSIALISTAQFVHILPKLKERLEYYRKKVVINNNGQILGCNVTNATKIQDKVSCFLYVGSGKFHPLAIA
ncbi:MAG: 2-(3-amino-3-carboxypropyl)histidine synthase subunit, partial [Candidatus Pacearchaeota archaeon]|nr:2-(3-amino-3-carboxypropyl)histidine synthase subunit [Candidatus Pacearchaeota archaeon]